MGELILTTYDWVPEPPRGYVRDLRIRWALEEAGLPYRVESTSFHERGPGHLAHQPFAQVPWLVDGDISVFESGAILLHLGDLSEALLPKDRKARSATVSWLLAAMNSLEMASLPWALAAWPGGARSGPDWERLDGFLKLRLQRLEPVLAKGEWLAGGFSIADVAMADTLRLPHRFGGLEGFEACRAYMERATARPAFKQAYADQLAHFAAAD